MKVFEIKIGRKWRKVRASSMAAINTYCKENKIAEDRKRVV
jgi:hypothetical protein